MSESNGLPNGWVKVGIDLLLEPLEDGRSLHHGWSPQCESGPSESDQAWGVLKTTAIQDGLYLDEHNKRLPDTLTPRQHLEVHAGDILLTCAGPRNRCGVPCLVRHTRPRLILSGKMYRFRVRKELMLPLFMEAFLRSKDTQVEIDKMKTGISDSGLNLTHSRFLRLQVPVAPLNEQSRIVAKIEELFSDLDAGVAALQRAKANLKRYRASVLKAAVEGKLTKDWRAKHPTTEPASKLLERILKDRRQKWEADQLSKYAAAGKQPPKNWKDKYTEPTPPDTTGLPELPKGWCWASVEQCATEVTVGHVGPMKDEYVKDGITFLRSQNVRPLRYDRVGLRFITDSFHNKLKKSKLFGGELLVVRSGNIGEACVYPDDQPEANCADLVITRLVKAVDAHYAAAFVVSPIGQALVGGKRTGSALSHFNVGAMAKGPLPLPSMHEQVEIVKTIAEKLSQIDSAETQIEHGLLRASRLRQSILRQAFEGKLAPQDPTDEPASTLLARLQPAEADKRGAGSTTSPRRAKIRK